MLEDVNSGKGKLGKTRVTTEGMWKRKWRKAGDNEDKCLYEFDPIKSCSPEVDIQKILMVLCLCYANTSGTAEEKYFLYTGKLLLILAQSILL